MLDYFFQLANIIDLTVPLEERAEANEVGLAGSGVQHLIEECFGLSELLVLDKSIEEAVVRDDVRVGAWVLLHKNE
jgi:hypothetical protein